MAPKVVWRKRAQLDVQDIVATSRNEIQPPLNGMFKGWKPPEKSWPTCLIAEGDSTRPIALWFTESTFYSIVTKQSMDR